MSIPVFIMIVAVLMIMAAPFVISFTAICYSLSPYSRIGADARLSVWERKTLYALAAYPFVSIALFFVLSVLVPNGGMDEYISIYCLAHALICIFGATGAWYLRRRNKKNTAYFVVDTTIACIYFAILLMQIFRSAPAVH